GVLTARSAPVDRVALDLRQRQRVAVLVLRRRRPCERRRARAGHSLGEHRDTAQQRQHGEKDSHGTLSNKGPGRSVEKRKPARGGLSQKRLRLVGGHSRFYQQVAFWGTTVAQSIPCDSVVRNLNARGHDGKRRPLHGLATAQVLDRLSGRLT